MGEGAGCLLWMVFPPSWRGPFQPWISDSHSEQKTSEWMHYPGEFGSLELWPPGSSEGLGVLGTWVMDLGMVEQCSITSSRPHFSYWLGIKLSTRLLQVWGLNQLATTADMKYGWHLFPSCGCIFSISHFFTPVTSCYASIAPVVYTVVFFSCRVIVCCVQLKQYFVCLCTVYIVYFGFFIANKRSFCLCSFSPL